MGAINTDILSADAKGKIDHWLSKYPANQRRSAVIPALHIAQDENEGWLPQEVMDAVADYLQIPRIAVYEVATFYSMFDLKKTGKNKINVCTNISCMLNGSKEIVSHLEKRLNVKCGETTSDGKYTLRAVECLGACVGAPMMQVNKAYYENLTPQVIDDILDSMEKANG